MIRERQKNLNILNAVTDAILMFLSYLAATYLRFIILGHGSESINKVWNQKYFTALILMVAAEVLIFYFVRLYTTSRRHTVLRQINLIIWIGLFSVFVLMAFLYFTRIVDFSRIAIIIYYALSTVILSIKRVIVRLVLKNLRKKGYNQKHVVLVGNGKHAKRFAEDLRKNPDLGYALDGYVCRTEREELGKHLGTYEDLEEILMDPGIDEVVVTLEIHEAQYMQMIVNACDKAGVRISIIPFFNDYVPANPSIDTIGESRIINIREIPLDHMFNAFMKRAMDIVGSLILIVLSSPFMLFVAIGVKLSSPGPILFKQERVGLNKKPFKMLKFRSMKINSSEKTGWSTDVDDRKTKFGSLIRKCSLDELPQFFNVLKGDMSLVGPRPEVPFYVDQFKEEIPLYLVRQQVRPGITGWAQVNGLRGDTSIPDRIKHDIWYIENWSLALDFKILFKTVFGGMVNSEKLNV